MAATNAQVQAYVDQRLRPMVELARKLKLMLDDNIAVIDDVYANLTDNPTWTDNRPDNPPHLLTPNDVLALNTFMNNVRDEIRDNAQLPIVLKACTHSPV